MRASRRRCLPVTVSAGLGPRRVNLGAARRTQVPRSHQPRADGGRQTLTQEARVSGRRPPRFPFSSAHMAPVGKGSAHPCSTPRVAASTARAGGGSPRALLLLKRSGEACRATEPTGWGAHLLLPRPQESLKPLPRRPGAEARTEGAAPRPGHGARDLGTAWSGLPGSRCGDRSHRERFSATESQGPGAPRGSRLRASPQGQRDGRPGALWVGSGPGRVTSEGR